MDICVETTLSQVVLGSKTETNTHSHIILVEQRYLNNVTPILYGQNKLLVEYLLSTQTLVSLMLSHHYLCYRTLDMVVHNKTHQHTVLHSSFSTGKRTDPRGFSNLTCI